MQKLTKGDIIFIKYKGINNKIISHPLVITYYDDERITAVDQRAIFAAITLSDVNNEHDKMLKKGIPSDKIYIPKEINSSTLNKEGVMWIDALNLFRKDVFQKNVKGHIPGEYVDRAIEIFQILEKANKVRFKIDNLPQVLHDK